MKALLIIISLITFSISADAQWYFNHCQATDINNCTPDQFDCLWIKANKLTKTGLTLTVIGTSVVAISSVILRWEVGGFPGYGFMIIGFPVGVLLDIIGIPCLATGLARKSQLKKNPYYTSKNVGKLNLTPTILRNQINNSFTMGLTISISI